MAQKQKVIIALLIIIIVVFVGWIFLWQRQQKVSYLKDWNIYEYSSSASSEIPSFKIYYPKDWATRTPLPNQKFDGISFRPAQYPVPTLENPQTYLNEKFSLGLIYRSADTPNLRETIFDEAMLRCEADGPMGSSYCLKNGSNIEEFKNIFGVESFKIIRKNVFIATSGEKKEWDDFVIVYLLPGLADLKYIGLIFMANDSDYLDVMFSIANTLRF